MSFVQLTYHLLYFLFTLLFSNSISYRNYMDQPGYHEAEEHNLEETSKGLHPKDLNHARRDLDSYQADVEEIGEKLQAALYTDAPSPMTMIVLQQCLANLDNMDRRGSRDVLTLDRLETDEGLMEADKAAKKAFRAVMAQAKSMGMSLLCLKTANDLTLDLDNSISSVERKQATNPTRDYSVTLEAISAMMTELKTSLKSSEVPRSHPLWSRYNELDERLQDLRATDKPVSGSDIVLHGLPQVGQLG